MKSKGKAVKIWSNSNLASKGKKGLPVSSRRTFIQHPSTLKYFLVYHLTPPPMALFTKRGFSWVRGLYTKTFFLYIFYNRRISKLYPTFTPPFRSHSSVFIPPLKPNCLLSQESENLATNRKKPLYINHGAHFFLLFFLIFYLFLKQKFFRGLYGFCHKTKLEVLVLIRNLYCISLKLIISIFMHVN